MSKSSVATQEVDKFGLFAEFDYWWKDKMGRNCFLSKDGESPMKYKVLTDLAILILCADYKSRKGFDIRFCSSIKHLTNSLEALYKEIQDFDGECKKALIYSIGLDGFAMDAHQERPTHVVPILFCKCQHPESGKYKIGIFFMDSSQALNKVNGTEEFREFMYQKRFVQGQKDVLLPLFVLEKETQADNFSCRIKAIVDMRRALALSGDNDPFRAMVLGARGDVGVTEIELPAILHKTTQNKKILDGVVAKSGEEIVSKKEGRETLADFVTQTDKGFKKILKSFGEIKISDVNKQTYLFDKTEIYLDRVEKVVQDASDALLDAMLNQSMPFGIFDEEIKRCFLERFLSAKEPASSPKVAGVVKSKIEVLHGNVDGGRL